MKEDNSVRSELVDAATITQNLVEGAARQTATAIAYQEVAQSLAVSVQSAVANLQGVFAISNATTGSAVAQTLIHGGNASDLNAILESSQANVAAAIKNLQQITANMETALKGFPTGLPGEAPSPALVEKVVESRKRKGKEG